MVGFYILMVYQVKKIFWDRYFKLQHVVYIFLELVYTGLVNITICVSLIPLELTILLSNLFINSLKLLFPPLLYFILCGLAIVNYIFLRTLCSIQSLGVCSSCSFYLEHLSHSILPSRVQLQIFLHQTSQQFP